MKEGKLTWNVSEEGKPSNLQGTRPAAGITVKGEEIVPATRKISAHTLKALRTAKIAQVEVETSEFDGAMTASDIVDMSTGELLYEATRSSPPTSCTRSSSPASPASRSSSPSAMT